MPTNSDYGHKFSTSHFEEHTRPKSEKLDHQIEQLELQLEDLQADEAESAREMPAADQAPRKKSVRRPLPGHLPRD